MKRKYLVEGLIAEGSINVLCGASGAGKTTWLLTAMDSYMKGNPILGHDVLQKDNRTFFYVGADRDEDDVEEMLHHLGLPTLQHVALLESASAVDFLKLAPPDTSIMAIDGVSMLIEGGKISDNDTVGKFLRRCRLWAKAHKCALWFLCHSPKKWKGEEIVNVRENILGSIAWGAFADTVVYAAKDDPSDPDNTARTFYVEPRHGKMEAHRFKFDEQGQFVEVLLPIEQTSKVVIFTMMTVGTVYKRKELVEKALSRSISPATLDRALKVLIAEGKVVKADEGEYAAVKIVSQIEGVSVG